MEQAMSLNDGYMIVYYEDGNITLMHEKEMDYTTGKNMNLVYLYYTKDKHSSYEKFAPKDVSSDDFWLATTLQLNNSL